MPVTHDSVNVHGAESFPEKSFPFLYSSDMMAIFLSVFVTIFTLRGTGAQTVSQSEDPISVFKGDPVQVECNYSYSGSPGLFWYVQYPNQGLQLLLKHISKESVKGFTASLDQREKSFHLKKQSAQEEDSAMYYCALSDTVTGFITEAKHKPFRS
uniref:Ig-like domain-containing protein n=1 Tax=Suricata suricatta TaxID=37032 RepID=A0A673TI96_SURSU